MKKNYTYPIMEILPFCAATALCVSGESTDSIGGGGTGGDAWDAHSPRRTAPF